MMNNRKGFPRRVSGVTYVGFLPHIETSVSAPSDICNIPYSSEQKQALVHIPSQRTGK